MSGEGPDNASDWWPGNAWKPQSAAQIASMSPEDRALYQEMERRYVFGVDYKTDPVTGHPIEQGIGSPGNMTPQARAALGQHADRLEQLKAQAGVRK
jgi:hypothetical protein